MAKVTYSQSSFNAGEISPRMQGRNDHEKYKSALALCENSIVLPQGGVMRRTGFEFIHASKYNNKLSELIPFEFSEDQSYVLEFGDLYMRVYMDGGIVVTPDSYTKLLLHCDGTDGDINFVDKSPSIHIMTVAGNAQIDTAYYYFSTGSMMLDGTGDYVSTPDHADFAYGAGEFTIDGWVRMANITRFHTIYSQLDATGTDYIWLYIDPIAGKLVFRVIDTGALVVDLRGAYAFTATPPTWYHIAVVQTATALSLYVNGSRVATQANVVMPDHSLIVTLGYQDSDTVFRNQGSVIAAITTAGDAVRSATQAKFGATSIKFDGTGDNLNMADNAGWDICSTANTVTSASFWVYPTVVAGVSLMSHYVDVNNHWTIGLNASALPYLNVVSGGTGRTITYGSSALTANAWYHLQIVKTNNNYGLWINGVQVAEGNTTTDVTLAGTMYVGTGNTIAMTGYMDDVVIDFANPRSLDPGKPVLDSSGAAKGYGLNVYDCSPSVASGAVLGSACLDFDGTNDYLYYADSTDWDWIKPTAEFTIECWVKHTDHVGSELYVGQFQDANNYWYLFHNHTYGVGLGCYAAAWDFVFYGTEITDSNWHHVLARGKSGHYGVWVDGIQRAWYYNGTATRTFAGNLVIGYMNGANYFDGQMDELRLQASDYHGIDPKFPFYDSSSGAHGAFTIPGTGGSLVVPKVGDGKFGTGALMFDGTDDYVYYADNADWDILDKANVTLDLWVQHDDHAGVEGYIQHFQANTVNWYICHSHGYGVFFFAQNAGTLVQCGGNPDYCEITDTSWHHLLVNIDGDHYGLWIDGIQRGYYYSTTNATFAGNLYYGLIVDNVGTNQYFDGRMDELHLELADTYTLTPAQWITDSSGAAKGVATQYGAGYSYPFPNATTYKWGVSALDLDGTNDYLTYADSTDWDVTNNTNYTIDFWVMFDAHAGAESIIGQYNAAASYWQLYHTHGSGWRFYMINGAATIDTGFGGEITDSNWHHIALCKVGNDYGIYKDGNQIRFVTDADTLLCAAVLTIGQLAAASYMNGKLDELRMTTANSFSAAPNVGLSNTITVPTGAHVSDANTKLLMHFDATNFSVPTAQYMDNANTKLLHHCDGQSMSPPVAPYSSDANTKLLMHMDSDNFSAPTTPTSPTGTMKLLISGARTPFQGHMDEIRVSSIARWTGASFALPTSEYPGGGGSVIYELVTPYTEADLEFLRYVQSTDTMYICHPDFNVRKLQRSDHDVWTITEITWMPPAWSDANTTAMTLDSGATTGAGVTLVASTPYFTADMVGAYFEMYSGWGVVTAVSDALNATWTILDDLTAHTATTVWRRGMWDADQGYPTTIGFHEDRLILSGVAEHPLTVFMSRVGDYEDFGVTTPTVLDDDSLTVAMWSQQQNAVKWVMSGKRLYVGTAGSEFWISGATVDTPITPTSIQAKPETSIGSSSVQPVMLDNAVVFVEQGGERVRLWSYTLASDGFETADLSMIAENLTAGNPIVKIQYAQLPHSVIWCTTLDGTLLGLTIIKEHKVVAWHHHTTGAGGVVESIAVIPGDDGDELWALIARTIGVTVERYIERLHPDFYLDAISSAFFVDSGLSYSGAPATNFAGLDHLEGQTISVLADGISVGPKTVVAGGFSITTAASVVHAGLQYNSNWQTLPWDMEGKGGATTDTVKKRIVSVLFKLHETSELQFGRDSSNLMDIPMTDGVLYTEWLFREFNGDFERDPSIYIRQNAPLPATVLGIVSDIDLGGK